MPRSVLAAAVFLTLVASAVESRGDDWPIPQNPEKARRARLDRLAWIGRTLAAPYDAVGKKDPRWDGIVHELMKAAVPLFDRPDDLATHDEVFQPARRAIEAGCDDPMVLYIYARTSTGRNFPGMAEFDERFARAATALRTSRYPAFRRAAALIRSGSYRMFRVEAEGRKQAAKSFEAALALLPESFKDDGAGSPLRRAWMQELTILLQSLSWLESDTKVAFEKIDAALAKAPAAKGVRLVLRGEFFTTYAWQARGSGMAATVTEDGWRRFVERATEARKALEAAWELDHDGEAAARMITVEMAIGDGNRPRMETWFQRAMEADGDNLDACNRKMNWLQRKWHGSDEEMFAFAEACRDTKNWRSGIPLLLPEALRRLAEMLPLTEREEAYKDPQFWREVKAVYPPTLEVDPEDPVIRSEYAGYCYLTSHYDEAHEQFEKLGDRLAGGGRFSEPWLKQVRLATAERVQGDMRPGSPGRKGFSLVQAKYGADGSWADVTRAARMNVASGRLALKTDRLPDPIFGTRKSLVIVYSVDGRVGLSTTAEGQEVVLPPQDAAKAGLADVPAEGFALLAARYGGEETWADVTETFRRRVADGRLEAAAKGLPDPINGVRKSLVLVYAWQGRAYAVILNEEQHIVLPTLQPPIGP